MHSFTVDAASGEVIDTTTDLLAVGNGGSGGVVSTAGELLDVMQAILSGDLLPAPLVAEMSSLDGTAVGPARSGTRSSSAAAAHEMCRAGVAARRTRRPR